MGAILDHADIEALADVGQPVHVGNVAAHVRKQQEARARLHRLGLEISHVDVVVGVDIHQNCDAADIVDGAWHRRQRVGVG